MSYGKNPLLVDFLDDLVLDIKLNDCSFKPKPSGLYDLKLKPDELSLLEQLDAELKINQDLESEANLTASKYSEQY